MISNDKIFSVLRIRHVFCETPYTIFFLRSFASGVGFPPLPCDFLHFYTPALILQRIIIMVGDAGFEPGTSAPGQKFGALPVSQHILLIASLFVSFRCEPTADVRHHDGRLHGVGESRRHHPLRPAHLPLRGCLQPADTQQQ